MGRVHKKGEARIAQPFHDVVGQQVLQAVARAALPARTQRVGRAAVAAGDGGMAIREHLYKDPRARATPNGHGRAALVMSEWRSFSLFA